MNDMSGVEVLNAAGGLAEAGGTVPVAEIGRPSTTSVRVSSGAYLALATILLLVSVWCFRSNLDTQAIVTWIIATLLVPLCSLLERVTFDGSELVCRGPASFFGEKVFGQPRRLALDRVESVESSLARTIRTGGRYYYRYRTEIRGDGQTIVFVSRGRAYRRMVREVFNRVPDEKLDFRSAELRDFLCEPEFLKMSLSILNFAPPSVLNSAPSILSTKFARARKGKAMKAEAIQGCSLERARALRLVANQLRVSGRLREAAEAFRRAAPGLKDDPSFVLEFARLLKSSSTGPGERTLAHRAVAALRLAASRSSEIPLLLTRIGETFVELGDTRRARGAFERALIVAPDTFRASLGLADIALRDGKLAHVIYQFHSAAREATDSAVVRFSEREATYFGNLNDDDEYLDRELLRMNWLENFERSRTASLRFAFGAVILAIAGPALDESLAGAGWMIASIATALWLLSVAGKRILSHRRTFTELA